MDIWSDPADGPSRQKMIQAYGREALLHLYRARHAAAVVFRESVQHNEEWERLAQDISALMERVKPGSSLGLPPS